MRRLSIVLLFTVVIWAASLALAQAEPCQLNGGAYITYEKRHIDEALRNYKSGRWSYWNIMVEQGKLRKIGRLWNIDSIQVWEGIVKFSAKVAPGKEIWTLKAFTVGCISVRKRK